jgi:hypothetical protein
MWRKYISNNTSFDALGIFNGDLAGEFGRLGSRWIRNDVGLDAASIQICTNLTLNTTDFVFLTDFSLYLT